MEYLNKSANVQSPVETEIAPRKNPQDVLIAIPTFRRSSRLKALLPHIEETLRSIHNISILIIDNNALPIEQKFVQQYAETSKYPIHYVHETRAGVSNARNAALNFASTRFLAFLDDDMEVTAPWIDSLVDVAVTHETGLVFGPLTAKFMDSADPRNPYLAPFYSRIPKQSEAGVSTDAFGTGGCLIDLETCVLPDPPFDTHLNESGGEDDIFFETVRKNGTHFGWAPDALCYECVETHRTTPAYIARRNFGFGQGPTRIAAKKGLAGFPQILRHMSVGLIQLGIFGLMYLVAKAMKRPSQIRYLALSARGLGKIFWFDRFRPKLYGNASLNT